MSVFPSHISPEPLIYCRSSSADPSFNLACEEWLLREAPLSGPILFVYRNASSVIIGRNQNPWRECALPRLVSEAMPVYRRSSGGGTVYHDHGNANFALIGHRRHYLPIRHLQLAAGALRRLGIEARINLNRDLYAGAKKISGSAFTLTSQRTLQHGTLLINSDLRRLRAALLPPSPLAQAISGRAVPSIRATVGNLVEFAPGFTFGKFTRSLLAVWQANHRKSPISRLYLQPGKAVKQMPGFKRYLDKYRSRQWQIARTPDFDVRWSNPWRGRQIQWSLAVCDGRVQTAAAISDNQKSPPGWARQLAAALVGIEFWPDTLHQTLSAVMNRQASAVDCQGVAGVMDLLGLHA